MITPESKGIRVRPASALTDKLRQAIKEHKEELPQQLLKRAFLAAYANMATVTHAAREAGINRSTHYTWLKEDEAYAEAFRYAQEEAADNLEAEARRRAFEGSDTLLIFLLKGARPEKYKDRIYQEHAGSAGAAPITVELPDEEAKSLKAFLKAVAREEMRKGSNGQSDQFV